MALTGQCGVPEGGGVGGGRRPSPQGMPSIAVIPGPDLYGFRYRYRFRPIPYDRQVFPHMRTNGILKDIHRQL